MGKLSPLEIKDGYKKTNTDLWGIQIGKRAENRSPSAQRCSIKKPAFTVLQTRYGKRR
jgi:hypothetical protein